MDERLRIKDAPRAGGLDSLASVPLVTIGWRALREAYRARAAEEGRFREAVPALAAEVHRLKRAARGFLDEAGGTDREAHGKGILRIARSIEETLSALGVAVVAPEGQTYGPELMEALDNIAQVTRPGIGEPVIAEVMNPAVIYRGEILRRGKAVIAVPAPAGMSDREDAGAPDERDDKD